MTKLSPLERMRLQRDLREAPLRRDYEQQIHRLLQDMHYLSQSLSNFKRTFGSEIAEDLKANLVDRLRRELHDRIMYEVAKVGPAQPVTITLDPRMAMLDPTSIDARILGRYGQDALPKLRLSISTDYERQFDMVRVTIPELTFGHAVVRAPSAPRKERKIT